MRISFVILSCTLVTGSALAQSVKVSEGRKMKVVMESQVTTTISAMGVDMDMESKNSIEEAYAVAAVNGTGYSLQTHITRLKNTVKAMGNETAFDSDNAADRNNEQYAELVKLLGKPAEIKIENRVARSDANTMINPVLSAMGIGTQSAELSKFILYRSDLEKIETGQKWYDSLQIATLQTKLVAEVTHVSDTAIEVAVTNELSMNILQLQGMPGGKLSGKGKITSRRWYNRADGVLKKEEGAGIIDAEAEMMDQRMPMAIKVKTALTVQ